MKLLDLIPGATPIRLALSGLVIAGIICALAKFGFHERQVEVAHLQKASQKVEQQAEAGTEANVIKAAIAARGAEDDQRAIDAYIAAHPDKPVRVCNQNDSGGGVRKAGTADAASGGTGSRSAAVPAVLEGDASAGTVDVTPAADVILRAAEAMDVLYRERQRRSDP